MRVSQSIYIARPSEDVFAFVADHKNDHLWRAELISTNVEGDVGEGVGTHVRQRVSYQGRTAETHLEVTEFEPGRRICFRAHGGVRAHGCYDVKPDGPGTYLTVSATVELKGGAAMLERFVRQAVEQAAAQDLQRLKGVLEGAPAT